MKSLVLYNNKYESTKGFINSSVTKQQRINGEKRLQNISISEALNLKNQFNCFYILKEEASGKEFIFNSSKIAREGFAFRLKGFEYKIFYSFKEVYDSKGEYEILEKRLAGEGIDSVEYAIDEIRYEEIIRSFNNLINENIIEEFIKSTISLKLNETETAVFIGNLNNLIRYLHFNIDEKFKLNINDSVLLTKNEINFKQIRKFNSELDEYSESEIVQTDSIFNLFKFSKQGNFGEAASSYLIAKILFNVESVLNNNGELNKNNYLEKLHLKNYLKSYLKRSGKDEAGILENLNLIYVLIKIINQFENKDVNESRFSNENTFESIEKFITSLAGEIFLKLLEDKKVKEYEIPVAGSLGLLALGDIGVKMWREKRDAEKANSNKESENSNSKDNE